MTTDTHNAPAGAPSNTSTPVQYSWSTDEETYQDRCESIEHAISEALNSGRDFEVGQTLYIGEAIPVEVSQLVDADSVIDSISCQAYELSGEVSEDYLAGVTKEQKDELESLIAAWADRVETPSFWQIGTIFMHTVTAQDLGGIADVGHAAVAQEASP